MIIKVCGMRRAENVADVAAPGIDMMGFIFYDKSPRYVSDIAPATPVGVARVGVFVNESDEVILKTAEFNNLSHIQLHGSESVELCDLLRSKGYSVIKVFSVAAACDFELIGQYEGHADLMLLDTKCTGHGGSGEKFDWSLLDAYTQKTPFLLSGGISDDDAQSILEIKHPMFAGVDLNSRFEIEPALKNVKKLEKFIKTIKL